MRGAWRYFRAQIPLVFVGIALVVWTIVATMDVEGRAGTVIMSAGVTTGVVVAVLPIMITVSIYLDDRDHARRSRG